jgi:hypothetical protein
VRKILGVTAAAAVGVALLSCNAPQPSAVDSATTSRLAYDQGAPVVRAPLSPPAGYASPPGPTDSPTPLAPYGSSPNEGAEPQMGAREEWRASPRWAAVKGDGCVVVEQDLEAAAQAEAAKMKVENCSKKDIDDLAPVQP